MNNKLNLIILCLGLIFMALFFKSFLTGFAGTIVFLHIMTGE